MNTYDTAIFRDQDHSTLMIDALIDPSIRVLLAFASFGQMFIFNEIQPWQPYIVGFGVYLAMTVIMKWDPVYVLYHGLNRSRVTA